MGIIITHNMVTVAGRNAPAKIQMTVGPIEGIMDVECGKKGFVRSLVGLFSNFQKYL